jgi:hypothetical protein
MPSGTEPLVVQLDPDAMEKARDDVYHWLRNMQEYGDLGPRLRRWMSVATLLAIGVNPEQPVIATDLLEPSAEMMIPGLGSARSFAASIVGM